MDNRPQFLNGLRVNERRENAPPSIIGSISINRLELLRNLQAMTDEWINLDIKVSSKTQKWYAAINSWKRDNPRPAQQSFVPPVPREQAPPPQQEINSQDIPF